MTEDRHLSRCDRQQARMRPSDKKTPTGGGRISRKQPPVLSKVALPERSGFWSGSGSRPTPGFSRLIREMRDGTGTRTWTALPAFSTSSTGAPSPNRSPSTVAPASAGPASVTCEPASRGVSSRAVTDAAASEGTTRPKRASHIACSESGFPRCARTRSACSPMSGAGHRLHRVARPAGARRPTLPVSRPAVQRASCEAAGLGQFPAVRYFGTDLLPLAASESSPHAEKVLCRHAPPARVPVLKNSTFELMTGFAFIAREPADWGNPQSVETPHGAGNTTAIAIRPEIEPGKHPGFAAGSQGGYDWARRARQSPSSVTSVPETMVTPWTVTPSPSVLSG